MKYSIRAIKDKKGWISIKNRLTQNLESELPCLKNDLVKERKSAWVGKEIKETMILCVCGLKLYKVKQVGAPLVV